jgi:hypothetical protein
VELGVVDNKESKWHLRKRGRRDSEEESDVMRRDQLFGSVSHLGSATLSTVSVAFVAPATELLL